MYSQANVRVESVLRPPTRALPSVIVDTEKVLWEAYGPTKARGPEASNARWVERCSPRCAPQEPDGESREEPEEHKRSSKRSASMITGISMDLETCQILGHVSLNLLYSKRKLLTDICGPGGD